MQKWATSRYHNSSGSQSRAQGQKTPVGQGGAAGHTRVLVWPSWVARFQPRPTERFSNAHPRKTLQGSVWSNGTPRLRLSSWPFDPDQASSRQEHREGAAGQQPPSTGSRRVLPGLSEATEGASKESRGPGELRAAAVAIRAASLRTPSCRGQGSWEGGEGADCGDSGSKLSETTVPSRGALPCDPSALVTQVPSWALVLGEHGAAP